MLVDVSIRFVNMGIEFNNLGKNVKLGDFEIAYYGIVIAIGMLIALFATVEYAKKTGQKADDYYDIATFSIVFGIVGARLYYVVFEWDEYKDNILSVFNIRNGGLAIYGGVIAGIITCVVFSKIKKIPLLLMLDTISAGLLIGQILGRWGNFFNREAFGGYTNNFFAMQIKLDEVGGVISDSVAEHIKVVDGIQYIQVHPTFLYESMWNVVILLVILIYRRKKRFNGDLSAIYMIGYGTGRFFIESLRTDQLTIFNTGIAVSQVVSIVMILVGISIIIHHFISKNA